MPHNPETSTTTDDGFDLERFVEAQRPVFERAIGELRNGRKRSHWMWFVFPQLRGLGASPMAQRYGIASLAEAHAYLAHPLLGSRLVTATRTVLAVEPRDLRALFGSPDDMKFRSCATLFARAGTGGDEHGVFREALDAACGGEDDARTVALLAAGDGIHR